MSLTTVELIECVDREIQMRERVYPRWVLQKKMTQRLADRELERMRGVRIRLVRAEAIEQAYGTTARDYGLDAADIKAGVDALAADLEQQYAR